MIKLTKNINKINEYVVEYFLYFFKKIIVVEIICFPFLVYFFLIGILVDNEALIYAFSILIVFVVLFIRMTIGISQIKTSLNIYFRKADDDGNIYLTLSFSEDLFSIENLNNKNIINFKLIDISCIKISKKSIWIKLVTNQVIFLPKTKELIEFLKRNGSNIK